MAGRSERLQPSSSRRGAVPRVRCSRARYEAETVFRATSSPHESGFGGVTVKKGGSVRFLVKKLFQELRNISQHAPFSNSDSDRFPSKKPPNIRGMGSRGIVDIAVQSPGRFISFLVQADRSVGVH
jgi:hypothetical protein